MVFQNVYDNIDKKTGEVHYRNDIVEQRAEDWVQSCPSTEGGHNWQAMSYSPAIQAIIAPLSQSCMEMSGNVVKFEEASGGTAARRRFFEMPWHQRQHRQAGGVRCAHAEGAVEVRTARAFHDRRSFDRR